MTNMKNVLKEENVTLKREKQDEDERAKKLKEKLKSTRNQLEQCFKQRSIHENEMEIAKQKIEVR